MDQPNLDNHVAIVHHQDKAGTWWAIEGRPGGVGWADTKKYLNSSYTTNNIAQPKTAEQRAQIAAGAVHLLGVEYDWGAIVGEAEMLAFLTTKDTWAQNWHGQGAPAHVICSSLAAYLYERAGLDHPTVHTPRFTTPADWEQFIITHRFEQSSPRTKSKSS